MENAYKLQKWVWTDADFDDMGWHDSRIYAFAFSRETDEFLIDIDYIFQWVDPEPGDKYYRFWVAPATLVFKKVYDIKFDLDTDEGLEIADITRGDARAPFNPEYAGRDTEWLWTVSCQEGRIQLRSVGYKLYVRSAPQFGQGQTLTLATRGGYSFARTSPPVTGPRSKTGPNAP